MTSKVYIFWLLEWDIQGVWSATIFRPRYILCKIDKNQIQVEQDGDSIIIPMSQVKSAERYRFYQGLSAGYATNLKISFLDTFKIRRGRGVRNEIYLVPIDPITHTINKKEIDTMIDILESFVSGVIPTQSENPYFRAFSYKNKLDKFNKSEWPISLHPIDAAINSGQRMKNLLGWLAIIPATFLSMMLAILFAWLMGWL